MLQAFKIKQRNPNNTEPLRIHQEVKHLERWWGERWETRGEEGAVLTADRGSDSRCTWEELEVLQWIQWEMRNEGVEGKMQTHCWRDVVNLLAQSTLWWFNPKKSKVSTVSAVPWFHSFLREAACGSGQHLAQRHRGRPCQIWLGWYTIGVSAWSSLYIWRSFPGREESVPKSVQMASFIPERGVGLHGFWANDFSHRAFIFKMDKVCLVFNKWTIDSNQPH